MWSYLLNVLHVLDQLANTLLGGDPRWTLSGRMGRDIALGRCKFCVALCWILGQIQTNHCAAAYKADQAADNDTGQITGI